MTNGTNGKESMRDILALMEKNGINVSGFEAEAEDLWRTLDDLSKTNPSEYQRFIEQQAANHNVTEPAEKDEKYFRPFAGFAVTTRTTGGDGLKIRDSSDPETMGKALYINFCSHEAIEVPMDSFGRSVKDSFLTSADGLQIPLIVGPLRDVSTSEIAVDVVFHPCIIDYCLKVPTKQFMNQIVDLAFEWVTQETSVTFLKSWKSSAASYMGGRGNDKKTPVLFPVSYATKQKDSKAKVSAMESPSSLLSSIREEHEDEKVEILNVSLTGSKKSVSISESPSTSTSSKSGSANSTQQKKPAVKKGFLLDRKDPGLYPDEGSSEGSGGSKGGSLARIMDKCKVVNMNADNTISEHPSMPPAAPSSAGAAAAASASGETVTGTMKKKKPFANKELDELFAKLDEDLKPLCTDQPSFDENALSDLAKALCSTDGMMSEEPGMFALMKDMKNLLEQKQKEEPAADSSAAPSTGPTASSSVPFSVPDPLSFSASTHSTSTSAASTTNNPNANTNKQAQGDSNEVTVLKIANKLGGGATVNTREDIQEDGVYLVVTISDADDAVLDLASADLQVSSNELVLRLGSDKGRGRYLTVKGFNSVDQSSTKASVSRKKRTLSVKMKYAVA